MIPFKSFATTASRDDRTNAANRIAAASATLLLGHIPKHHDQPCDFVTFADGDEL